jgi:GTPase
LIDDHDADGMDAIQTGTRRSRRPVFQEASTSAAKTARAAVIAPFLVRPGVIALREPEARLEEACGLAAAIDLDIVHAAVAPLRALRPATLLGSGKVAEIAELVAEDHLELVVVDFALSPVQQRNLEKAWNAKVLDRTGLILEIFGRRARTKEGVLQVELAHLSYQKSRLVRSWTHLERQRGGAGFLGGPGESQLELDQRMLQDRIDGIKKELAQVVKTRDLHRAGRARVPYPVVALVGYTNAGKSTLFNTLTGAGVLAQDLLFATLDPTMREVKLPSGRRIILSDTVGFISELPTSLIAAFRATLEEVVGADLILHVRDIAHEESDAQRVDVERVLRELGLVAEGAESKVVQVWNKIDLLVQELAEAQGLAAERLTPPALCVSAVTGDGIARMLARIDQRLAVTDDTMSVEIGLELGSLVHWLYENTEVLETSPIGDEHMRYHVRIEPHRRGQLAARLAQAGHDRARIARPPLELAPEPTTTPLAEAG